MLVTVQLHIQFNEFIPNTFYVNTSQNISVILSTEYMCVCVCVSGIKILSQWAGRWPNGRALPFGAVVCGFESGFKAWMFVAVRNRL